jgi:hypothetical protein
MEYANLDKAEIDVKESKIESHEMTHAPFSCSLTL